MQAAFRRPSRSELLGLSPATPRRVSPPWSKRLRRKPIGRLASQQAVMDSVGTGSSCATLDCPRGVPCPKSMSHVLQSDWAATSLGMAPNCGALCAV